MSDSTSHRKRITHFDDPGHSHLLTFFCYRRRPSLTFVYDNWEGAPGLPWVTRLNSELIGGYEMTFERSEVNSRNFIVCY